MISRQQRIFFDEKLFNVFSLVKVDTFYLLLTLSSSTGTNNIYDVIKVPDNDFNKDFQDLLMYFLPYGVKIVGGLYFKCENLSETNNNHSVEIPEIKDNFIKDISLVKKSIQNYLIEDFIYFLELDLNQLNSKIIDITEKLSYYTIENEIILKPNPFKELGFKNLTFNLQNYYCIFSLKNISLTIHMDKNYNILDNEPIEKLFTAKLLMKLDDLNYIIEATGDEEESVLKKKIKEKLLKKNFDEFMAKQGVQEYFSEQKEISISLLSCSQSNKTEITFINICQQTQEEVIKTIKVNLSYIALKDNMTLNLEFFNEIKEYFLHMISSLYQLNTTTTYAYSLYTYYKNLIPFNILFSKKENYDPLEESLYSQRKYFMELHSLDLTPDSEEFDFPFLKTQQLEKYSSLQMEQIELEHPIYRKIKGIFFIKNPSYYYPRIKILCINLISFQYQITKMKKITWKLKEITYSIIVMTQTNHG